MRLYMGLTWSNTLSGPLRLSHWFSFTIGTTGSDKDDDPSKCPWYKLGILQNVFFISPLFSLFIYLTYTTLQTHYIHINALVSSINSSFSSIKCSMILHHITCFGSIRAKKRLNLALIMEQEMVMRDK